MADTITTECKRCGLLKSTCSQERWSKPFCTVGGVTKDSHDFGEEESTMTPSEQVKKSVDEFYEAFVDEDNNMAEGVTPSEFKFLLIASQVALLESVVESLRERKVIYEQVSYDTNKETASLLTDIHNETMDNLIAHLTEQINKMKQL